MSNHETFVRNTWAELLERDDIVGGNVYFNEDGYNFVGRIGHIEDTGDRVRLYLDWCGRKTNNGWTRRKRAYVTRMKVRLGPYPPDGPVTFLDVRLCFKGRDSFEESNIIAPMTRAQHREARRRKESGEDPGPLFTARPK